MVLEVLLILVKRILFFLKKTKIIAGKFGWYCKKPYLCIRFRSKPGGEH